MYAARAARRAAAIAGRSATRGGAAPAAAAAATAQPPTPGGPPVGRPAAGLTTPMAPPFLSLSSVARAGPPLDAASARGVSGGSGGGGGDAGEKGAGPVAPTPLPPRADAIPTTPFLLGIGGLIPFATAAGLSWSAPPAVAAMATSAGIAYGATILSFLGGVHWGVALTTPTPSLSSSPPGGGVASSPPQLPPSPAGSTAAAYVYSVCPPLAAAAILLAADEASAAAALAGGIAIAGVHDAVVFGVGPGRAADGLPAAGVA
ncbi:hypothetical protein MMPV_008538 [Pyropia vietnamensis]